MNWNELIASIPVEYLKTTKNHILLQELLSKLKTINILF